MGVDTRTFGVEIEFANWNYTGVDSVFDEAAARAEAEAQWNYYWGPKGIYSRRPYNESPYFTVPGDKYSWIADYITDERDAFENDRYYEEVYPELPDSFSSAGWDIHDEHCGFEMISPVLRGPEGFKELKRAFDFLNANGARVSRACGMHVHHGADDLSRADKVKLIKSWTENQEEIWKFTPTRRTSDWCRPWRPDLIERYESGQHYGSRYLTVSPESHHGTIEIRQHHGTLDFEEAAAWVKFTQDFIRRTLKNKAKPMTKCADVETLLKRVKVGKKHKDVLLKKALTTA